MEVVFSMSGILVLPVWALLLLAPHWRLTQRLLESPLVILAPALLYAALALPQLTTLLPVVVNPKLGAVAQLLGQARGATLGWVHFLAFDLFVARWIYLDARERKLTAWVVTPLLLLTLLTGPLGWLAYIATRERVARKAYDAARTFLAQAWRGSPALVSVLFASAAVALVSLVLQLLDTRLVAGVSTWVKPAKFGVSIALAAATFAWILPQLGPISRRLRRAGVLLAATAFVELVLITTQAARGVPSHFNSLTALDSAIFAVMGVSIGVFWLTQAWLTYISFRRPFLDSPLGWGIRLGLLVSTLGAGIGFGMTGRTTPAQQTAIAAGHASMRGGHAIGVEDGGPGLPGTQWSTEGGDLRVSHFLGLHALQALPLLGVALARRRREPAADGSEADASRVVRAGGATYTALMTVTLLQALRGQPLSQPDALTTLLALAAMTPMAFAAWTVWRPRLSSRVRASFSAPRSRETVKLIE